MAKNHTNEITTKVKLDADTSDALDPKVQLQASMEGIFVPFQNSILPYQDLYLSFEETFIQYASFSVQQLEAEYDQFLNSGEDDLEFLDLEFEQLFEVPVDSGGAELAELLLVVNEGTVQSLGRNLVIESFDDGDSKFKRIDSKERDLNEENDSVLNILDIELPPDGEVELNDFPSAIDIINGSNVDLSVSERDLLDANCVPSNTVTTGGNIFDLGASIGADVAGSVDINNIGPGGTKVVGSDRITLTTPEGNVLIMFTQNVPATMSTPAYLFGDFIYQLTVPLDHIQGLTAPPYDVLNSDIIFREDFQYILTDNNGDTAQAVIGIDVTDDGPSVSPQTADTIDEADVQTTGSNGAATVPTVTGTLMVPNSNIFGADGGIVSNITIPGGTTVIAGNMITVTTSISTLVVNQLTGAYTYSLTSPIDNDNVSNPADISTQADVSGTQVFEFTFLDNDNDSEMSTITFEVIDDEPVATQNSNTVNETAFFVNGSETASGNILTDDDGDGTDVFGADGGMITLVNGVADGGVGDLDGKADGVITAATTYGEMAVTIATGAYTYTLSDTGLDGDKLGKANDTFAYQITDGDGDTSTATIDIAIDLNESPNAVDDAYSTDEDNAVTIASLGVLSNDTDPDDSADTREVISIDTTGTLGSVSVAKDGTVNYDPNGKFESLATGEQTTDTFTYTIADAEGLTSTATVTMTVTGVNDAPIADDDAYTTDEDNAVTIAAAGVLIGDTDVDASDVLTVDAVNGVTASVGSQITLASGALLTVNSNGSLSYDPNSKFESLAVGESTTDSFTYTVTDSNGGTDTATVTMTINGVNDAPVTSDIASTAIEDGVDVTTSFVVSDIDATDAHTFIITSSLAAGEGTVVNNMNGTFTYSPGSDFQDLGEGETRQVSFTYTATDDSGAMNATSVAKTVTVTVTGTNDQPVASDVAIAATEDGLSVNGNFVVSDVDVANTADTHTFVMTSSLAAGEGTVVNNMNGTFTYSPGSDFQSLAAGETQDVTFTYTAMDDSGAVNATSVAKTITVTVTGVNDAPVLVSGASLIAIDEDTIVNPGQAISALLTYNTDVTDVDAASSQSGIAITANAANAGTEGAWEFSTDAGVTWLAIGAANDIGAAVALSVSTLVRFNPVLDYNGTPPALSFRALDNTFAGSFSSSTGSVVTTDSSVNGGTTPISSASNTLNIVVNPINDAPIAVADVDSGNEGNETVASVPVTGNVLTNDTDVDSLQSAFTATAQVVVGTYGTLTLLADGSYSYVIDDANPTVDALNMGANVSEVFNYTMNDNNPTDPKSSNSTLSITIDGTNDAPVAVVDVDSGTEGTAITPSVPVTGNVLTNDTDVDNVLGDFSATAEVTVGDYGTLTMLADGSYSYVINDLNPAVDGMTTGDTLVDVFNYTMSDGSKNSNSTLSITINGANDAPIAIADVFVEVPPALPSYNLTFTIDVSGSMDDIPAGASNTRLEIVQQALAGAGNLFDSYANVSAALSITIISFRNTATTVGTFTDVASAKAAINGLSAGGGTDYQDALIAMTNDVNADALLPGLSSYEDRIYFISDGKPNPPDEITPAEEVAWQALMLAQDINAFVFNIAPDGAVINEFLEPIANSTDVPLVTVVAADLSNLDDLLLSTVNLVEVTGNIITNDTSVDDGIVVTNIFFDLANATEASDYITNNPGLVGATAVGSTVTIPISNIDIPTPEGELITVNPNGSFSYRYANVAALPPTENMSYTITDDGGLISTNVFTITITDNNQAPVLINGATLTSINEDPALNSGEFVSSLIVFGIDVTDSGSISSQTGIAVIANTANAGTEGAWEFSTDAGTTWLAVGAADDVGAAVALSVSTLVRFNPVADYNGTPPALSFRALDNTYAGSFSDSIVAVVTTNTTTTGGTTAISSASNTLDIVVNPINDAPILVNGATLTAIDEDPAANAGQAISALLTYNTDVTDVDAASSQSGIAVISNAANAITEGAWEFSTNAGTTWLAVGAADDTGLAVALSVSTLVRFNPVLDYNGTPPALSIRALDNVYVGGFSDSTTAVVTMDSSTNGGTTAVSSASNTLGIVVNPINDAPVINNLDTDSSMYKAGDSAAVIEQGGDATVTDIDSDGTLDNFNSGVLTIEITNNAEANDTLSIQNQGMGAGQIGVSGSSVTFEGIEIGIIDGASTNGKLIINLDADAKPLSEDNSLSELVQAITFENTNDSTTASTRTVSFTITDGDGGTSSTVNANVEICSLVVNTTMDVVSSADSLNSLREAIDCANAHAGTDTITLGSGTYTLSLAGTGDDLNATGDLDVTDSLIIEGAGAANTIIDANDIDRVLEVLGTGTSLILRDLTITGGNVTGSGGGVQVAVDNSLILENVTFSSNEATLGGGAIQALEGSTVTLTNSLFDTNVGGVINIDADMANLSTLTINNSTFQNNTLGGFIIDENFVITTISNSLFRNNLAAELFGKVTINESIFDNNNGGEGGAFRIRNGSSVSVSDSTFSNNFSTDDGGAITVRGALTLINSTLSGNAAGDRGGAIAVITGAASANIFNSTITLNSSGSVFGGGIDVDGGTVELTSTIVAGNTSTTNANSDVDNNGGTATSGGNNLIGINNGAPGFSGGAGDQSGTSGSPLDAQLGVLQDNGGFTAGETSTAQTVQTHLPDVGSPVIDMGSNTQTLTEDQRGTGFARVNNGTADVGAIETIPPVILDLDGDGIELVSVEDATVLWTAEDGSVFKTGWVGADDGILVYDANQDGQFSGLEEIQFANYHVDANTDLEGLALAFDSNQDGVFDAQDAEFSQFAIWQDINQDGVSQANEFTSIIDSTVESIYLTSDGIQSIVEGNIIYGTSYYLDTSGNSYAVGDVGLQIQDVLEDNTIESELGASLPESTTNTSTTSESLNDPAPQDNAAPTQDQTLNNNIEQQNNPDDFGV